MFNTLKFITVNVCFVGSTAARIFMKGAVKSKTKNAGYTVYVKDGSKETACREFLASVTDQNTIKGFSNLHGVKLFY